MKYIVVLFILFSSCKENKTDKVKHKGSIENKADTIVEEIKERPSFNTAFFNLQLQKLPLTENTSFDSYIDEAYVNKLNPEAFSLPLIYENWYDKGYNYMLINGYRIEISKKFYSAVLTVKKGDNEMETTLINYDLNGKVIDSKLIAYDEIAESISKTKATLEKDFVTIIDETNLEETVVEISKFHINTSGEFNVVKDVFTSTIRPNEAILLKKTYIDTIQFQSYNDDGDYKLLFGKKNNQDVILIYNYDWELEDKYNFNPDDLIEITWKMDSIWIAGDGETLDFEETIIEVRKYR